jgi:hypothetical protein
VEAKSSEVVCGWLISAQTIFFFNYKNWNIGNTALILLITLTPRLFILSKIKYIKNTICDFFLFLFVIAMT